MVAAIAIAGTMLLAIGSVQAGTVSVKAVNFEFQPPSRTVKVGDVVRWTFEGDTHTVTSGTSGVPDDRFDSGFEVPGGSFQVTFDRAGTFSYFCRIHSQMTGEIIVKAGATPTPRPTPRQTPKPTARPTARPTAATTEAPTPTEAPTASPTESAAPSAVPTVSPTLSPAAASSGPGGSVAPSPAPSIVPGEGDAAASMDPAAIVAIAIVIGLLVAGGLALARRSRRI